MSQDLQIPMTASELEAFEYFKDDIKVLVDIGCRENFEYSEIKPAVKAYLFDANEYFINRLNEKVKGKKNIKTFAFGLSNRNEEVQYDDDSESIQEHRFRKSNLTTVKIRKFDEVMKECKILGKIDFLKVDIEGCEPDILEHYDVIKDIKYVQFEFGRGWADLDNYNVWSVIEQYSDTHKFYYLKDPNHSICRESDLELFTLIDRDFHDQLHRKLVGGAYGEGGNVWMIKKEIAEELGV